MKKKLVNSDVLMLDFTCKQSDLSFALNTVTRAINSTNTLPVLNNVLFEVKEGKVFLAATNLEIAIKTSLPAKIKTEGSLTVPAKLLTSYVQLISKDEVNLSQTRDLGLEISADKDLTKIKGIKADDFPLIPEIEAEMETEIASDKLLEVLQRTAFAASLQSSRAVLTGVQFKFSGKELIAVATDSYRLAEQRIALEKETGDYTIIIPLRTANELIKILGSKMKSKVKVKLSKNQAEFAIEEVKFVTRLIDGQFPDYEKIIPQEEKSKVTVGKSDLELALKKISLFAREVNNNMKLEVEDKEMVLSTDETKVGLGEVTIACSLDGDKNEISLNSQYLQDVLNCMSQQQVMLVVNDKLAPMVVRSTKDDSYLYLIMPLKA